MQKYIIALIIMVSSTISLLSVEWANPAPIRQGVNIEWFRSGIDTADNCAIYVWSDTKLGARDLYAQKVDASGNSVWGEPLLVDGKPDRQEDPVITRTSDNNFIIAWIDFSDDPDGNVYAQKVSPNGNLLWQTGGVPVCVYFGIQISLNIEPDNAGGAYIVWEDNRNPGKDIYGQHLSSTGAPLWDVNGNPVANDNNGDESYNTMWADGTGGLIIGYVYNLAGDDDLYVKRFLSNGQMAWPQALPLSVHAAKQIKIKMSPINSTSFVFTWMDYRNVHPDIYAQRVDLDGNMLWANPLIVYSDATSDSSAQENPRIVHTNDDGVIIIWEDKRYGVDNPDLFAQKLDLSGQRLWNVNGVPLCVADFGQSGPRMSADDNGGCYVVWDDARNGNNPNIDIYAQHLSSTGSSLWVPNGKPICTAANEQSGSLIKVSGSNIFINWMDIRNGSVGLNYQVLNTSGTTLLAENGVSIFWGLSGDAELKDVVFLPRQNDVLVVWKDTRFANMGYQIFYQTINSNGTVGFETNGRPVTTLTGNDQLTPAAVVLPDNSFVIVWEEKRLDNPKIYAQLIDANGNRLWGDTGIAVTDSEPLRQKDPRVSYENGAIYIGWSNLNSVTTTTGQVELYYVYGQKIENNLRVWGNDGILISQVPPESTPFECELESLVGRYFVWRKSSQGNQSIWTRFLNPDGTSVTGWSDYGIAVGSFNLLETSQVQSKAVLTDNGIFIGWLDLRVDARMTVYGQLVSPSAQLLWDASGVPMADYGREQTNFSLVGGNNVTLAWKENIDGSNQDIAFQRYSLNGSSVFGGFAVERDSTQSSPFLAKFPDPLRDIYVVAWEDYSNPQSDIKMRFIVDGLPVGDAWGEVVCDDIMIQQYPLISVLNNENSAIIIWADGRSSGKTPIFGIYAQKFNNTYADAEDDHNHLAPIVRLKQNYPNPFNPDTKIDFVLNKDVNDIDLSIYNLKGQKVKTLFNGKSKKGNQSFIWNGLDDNRTAVASGVYFYKLKADNIIKTKKMVLMK